ncbi:MAG: hypothetical protein AAGF24_12780 [Cyanobacteria bacterium P01_H01_bin.121]
MKLSPTLFTLSTLAFSIGISSVAEAKDVIGLSFELEPTSSAGSADATRVARAPTPGIEPASSDASGTDNSPLPVPRAAVNPPFAGDAALPANVFGGGQALALSDRTLTPIPLPAPPPVSRRIAPTQGTSIATSQPPRRAKTDSQSQPPEAIDTLLGFDLAPRSIVNSPEAPDRQTKHPSATPPATVISQIFRGGVESLVARAVGSAEGTRTPEGHKTKAYFGHVDPGNGVWNLGTFSYQHTAQTPEEADAKQLRRLQSQSLALKQKAHAHNLVLSLEELLNGIDLANQAPMAALDRAGYVEWLAEARKLGMTGSEAIIWARTRAFIDPDTQRWNAPGLGNNIHSITQDQSRRVDAVARAVRAQTLPLPDTSFAPEFPTITGVNASSTTVQASEDIGLKLDQVLNETLGALPHTTPENTERLDFQTQSQQSKDAPILALDADMPLPPDPQPQIPPAGSSTVGAIAPPKELDSKVSETIHQPQQSSTTAPPNPSQPSLVDTEAAVSNPASTAVNLSLPEPFANPIIDFPDQAMDAIGLTVVEAFSPPQINEPHRQDSAIAASNTKNKALNAKPTEQNVRTPATTRATSQTY